MEARHCPGCREIYDAVHIDAQNGVQVQNDLTCQTCGTVHEASSLNDASALTLAMEEELANYTEDELGINDICNRCGRRGHTTCTGGIAGTN